MVGPRSAFVRTTKVFGGLTWLGRPRCALGAVRRLNSITEGERSGGGRGARRSARVGGARRGDPSHFARVSQHLPGAAGGGGRY